MIKVFIILALGIASAWLPVSLLEADAIDYIGSFLLALSMITFDVFLAWIFKFFE